MRILGTEEELNYFMFEASRRGMPFVFTERTERLVGTTSDSVEMLVRIASTPTSVSVSIEAEEE